MSLYYYFNPLTANLGRAMQRGIKRKNTDYIILFKNSCCSYSQDLVCLEIDCELLDGGYTESFLDDSVLYYGDIPAEAISLYTERLMHE
jgi:hypothetical protein